MFYDVVLIFQSRKEAREAFLRSETMGLSKKLDPAAVNQDQNNISSNHEKDALSQKYSSNSTAPIISLPSINHSATSTTVAGNRSKSFKEQESYVGFANLPNQVYRKSVKRGFEFTLMLVGRFIGLHRKFNGLRINDLFQFADAKMSSFILVVLNEQERCSTQVLTWIRFNVSRCEVSFISWRDAAGTTHKIIWCVAT